jgi:hypothetical protein
MSLPPGWLSSGSKHIGKKIVRIFPKHSYVNATIIGWLPPDGADPPLWRCQHDDGDDEDLEEFEVEQGLKNASISSRHSPKKAKTSAQKKNSAESSRPKKASSPKLGEAVSSGQWMKTGHAFIGRRVRRHFNGHGTTDGIITMYMPKGGSDPALWHVVHEDGDEEDLELKEVEEAFKLVRHKKNENDNPVLATAVAGTPICLICFIQADSEKDPIISCKECNVSVHQDCYGMVKRKGKGPWLCARCAHTKEMKKKKIPIRRTTFTCGICQQEDNGAVKPTVDACWAHLTCALMMPKVSFGDNKARESIKGVRNIPPKMCQQPCSLCSDTKGAKITCNDKSCIMAFHPICAFQHRLLVSKVNRSLKVVCHTCCKAQEAIDVLVRTAYVVSKYMEMPTKENPGPSWVQGDEAEVPAFHSPEALASTRETLLSWRRARLKSGEAQHAALSNASEVEPPVLPIMDSQFSTLSAGLKFSQREQQVWLSTPMTLADIEETDKKKPLSARQEALARNTAILASQETQEGETTAVNAGGSTGAMTSTGECSDAGEIGDACNVQNPQLSAASLRMEAIARRKAIQEEEEIDERRRQEIIEQDEMKKETDTWSRQACKALAEGKGIKCLERLLSRLQQRIGLHDGAEKELIKTIMAKIKFVESWQKKAGTAPLCACLTQ